MGFIERGPLRVSLANGEVVTSNEMALRPSSDLASVLLDGEELGVFDPGNIQFWESSGISCSLSVNSPEFTVTLTPNGDLNQFNDEPVDELVVGGKDGQMMFARITTMRGRSRLSQMISFVKEGEEQGITISGDTDRWMRAALVRLTQALILSTGIYDKPGNGSQAVELAMIGELLGECKQCPEEYFTYEINNRVGTLTGIDLYNPYGYRIFELNRESQQSDLLRVRGRLEILKRMYG